MARKKLMKATTKGSYTSIDKVLPTKGQGMSSETLRQRNQLIKNANSNIVTSKKQAASANRIASKNVRRNKVSGK